MIVISGMTDTIAIFTVTTVSVGYKLTISNTFYIVSIFAVVEYQHIDYRSQC